MRKGLLRWGLMGTMALFVLLQAVPYGRSHTSPPVTQEPAWDTPQTRALAVRACYDCHSNETKWPWYSHVAPVSWLVQRDVDLGRHAFNFSEWNRPQPEAGEAAETVQDGTMPLPAYLLTHPAARLSDAERQAMLRGLQATIGTRRELEAKDEVD